MLSVYIMGWQELEGRLMTRVFRPAIPHLPIDFGARERLAQIS